MIMPCDDARGCGTFTVQNSKLDDMTYTPIQELPYEHMTGYMPGNAAPVPGTTNVPTPSGVVASERTGTRRLRASLPVWILTILLLQAVPLM